MPHIGPEVTLDNPAFIHTTALIHGKTHLGTDVSVWPHVVMRAEMFEIRIGARTNIQDFVMIHVGMGSPTIVGEDCCITHHVTLHGCEIGDRTLVGINATVMDGARIGANSIVAGHSIVRENAEFPDNSVIAGVPARKVKTMDCSELNLPNVRFYLRNALNYARGIERLSIDDIAFVKGDGA